MNPDQMKQIMGGAQAPTSSSGGITIDQMNKIIGRGGLSPDQAATVLGHTTSQVMNIFNSPLQNIAAGQGGNNLEIAKGAGKQAFGDFASAGAQNAGPIGADMESHAGGFFDPLKQVTQLEGVLQKEGAAQTMLAEGAIPGATGKLARGEPVANAIKGFGQKVAEMFIPRSAGEAKAVQAYRASTPLVQRTWDLIAGNASKAPVTSASTAFEKGLIGGESAMGVQAKRATNDLWKNTIAPALKASPVKQDMSSLFADAEKEIIKDVPELGDRNAQTEALKAIEEEYKNNPVASMEELQGFKQGWAKHVPQKYYQGKDISGVYNNVRAQLASMARTKLYEALGPEAKQAYLDYSNLQGITDLGQSAMTGKIKGGFGTSLKNILEMVTVPAGTIGGQTVYKVGRGVELLGPVGATTVRSLISSMTSGSQQNTQEGQEGGFPQ